MGIAQVHAVAQTGNVRACCIVRDQIVVSIVVPRLVVYGMAAIDVPIDWIPCIACEYRSVCTKTTLVKIVEKGRTAAYLGFG